jgi:hypothetical protein
MPPKNEARNIFISLSSELLLIKFATMLFRARIRVNRSAAPRSNHMDVYLAVTLYGVFCAAAPTVK